MAKILVIDDDTDICMLLKRYLEKHELDVDTAFTLRSGMQKFKKMNPDVVLCDFRLPDGEGIEAIDRIRNESASAQVIIMTGYSDVKVAIDCIKRGAYEYVTKPIHPEEILVNVKDALKRSIDEEREERTQSSKQEQKTTKGNRKSKTRKSDKQRSAYVEGESPQSKQVTKLIDLVAPTNMSVVIVGETGTGKEYVAKRIHGLSPRADVSFIAIDCGALPKEIATSELFGHKKGSFTGALNDKKGAFEMANGGTLFLDEVANLSYDNQVKLLRVLQERKIRRIGEERERRVDVRIIAATNENLWNLVKDGGFREDLYHRLNEFNIQLSPLRERVAEIKQFGEHFITQANDDLDKNIQGLSKKALEVLINHHWHGNLRELRNVLKRAVLLSESSTIQKDDLPVELREPSLNGGDTNSTVKLSSGFNSLKEAAEAAERAMIIRTLERTAYNKSKTADILKVDRKTLYNKISAYGIDLKA